MLNKIMLTNLSINDLKIPNTNQILFHFRQFWITLVQSTPHVISISTSTQYLFSYIISQTPFIIHYPFN